MSMERPLLCSLICIAGLALPHSAWAEPDRLAALLIRFSQYTEFSNRAEPIQLCVLNDTRIISSLNRLLPDFDQFAPAALSLSLPAEVHHCHVVWSAFPHWPPDEWLQVLTNQPLLWISDHPDLFRRGVMVSVQYTPHFMRFRVNQSQAKSKNIRFHSRLLQLAHEII